MPIAVISLVSAMLYLVATALQLAQLSRNQAKLDRDAFGLSLVAIVLHAYIVWQRSQAGGAADLDIVTVALLILLIVNLLFLVLITLRPLQNLCALLFPPAALLVLFSALSPPHASGEASDLSSGMLAHITLSILAYAILTLAAVQAMLVAVQDHRLKKRKTKGLVRLLPPLQLMETMLFELIRIGVVLLTLSIASGAVFIENMFAQSLAHKTILTSLAWLVFSVLLWGRYRRGWRSKTAVRFTMAGFFVLMLGYFGSKFVLEVLLAP